MKIRLTALLAAAVLSMGACQRAVYDYEGDCTVTYNLRFVYDMNLKWADAFPSEVHSVNLFVFDQAGRFVTKFSAKGPALDEPGYTMQLDLEPGDYRLIAWCGLHDVGADDPSFALPTLVAGQSTVEDLTCSLKTMSDDRYPEYERYSDQRLNFLYHGDLKVNLPETPDRADFYYTMYLTKDTNHIRVILQQLSAEDMDPKDFQFRIEDANGVLAHDNALIGTQTVTYLPWEVKRGNAAVGKDDEEDTRALVYVDGIIADFTVSRLMEDHRNDLMLTIYNTEHELTIARVPIIQYALLSKEYYELAYGHPMEDQEFLDREDEYVLTFFLDEFRRWIDSSILIHSWRVVLDEPEFGYPSDPNQE